MSEQYPVAKFDDVAWYHSNCSVSAIDVDGPVTRPTPVWIRFEGEWYDTSMDQRVIRYGGPSGMRVVDSLDEVLQILHNQRDCIRPKLFVLSPETYCSIMQRQDGLRFLEFHPDKLCGTPYVINKAIR
jgi:hypothetical protein